MRFLPILLLSVIFLTACDENEDVNPDKIRFRYYEAADIHSEYPYVEAGEGLVLHLYFQSEDAKSIADDEFAFDLFIQMDSPGSEFDLRAEDLEAGDLLYQEYCYCLPITGVEVLSMNLSGKKQSMDWLLVGQVELKFTYGNEDFEVPVSSDDRVIKLNGRYIKGSID